MAQTRPLVVTFNFNSVFLECGPITIGDNVFVGPNVSFFTPVHPRVAEERNMRIAPDGRIQLLEYAKPITIGSNVWIGGGVIINPGVTIGGNVVIGSGSVVTRDIPLEVIAAGVPCRVIREIQKQVQLKAADKRLFYACPAVLVKVPSDGWPWVRFQERTRHGLIDLVPTYLASRLSLCQPRSREPSAGCERRAGRSRLLLH